MPYIKKKDREELDLNKRVAETPGELNYAISSLINSYIDLRGDMLTYFTINEIIGVLECCKLEIYRRIAAPYEDRKIKENGDVFNHA